MSAQSEILAYLISQAKPEAAGKSAVDAAIKDYRRMRHPGAEKTKRKPISKALRFQIYKRQNGKCKACHLSIAIDQMEIDHYEPASGGGEHSVRNFRGLCKSCNRQKGSRDPIADSKRTGATILESMPKGE